MENRSNSWILSVLLVLSLSLLGTASHSIAGDAARKKAASPGVLDGKVFIVETGEMGKKADEKDTLSFWNGKLHSLGCDRYGFGDAAYTASVEGETIVFAAETHSAKKGKIKWEGTVRRDRIDVTYVWTDTAHWYKPNPKPLEKWAKGELKKSE